MKIPLKWLKDYVDIKLSPQEVAKRLTMAGGEIERLHFVGGNWESIVVGELTGVNPHPNADRLHLATVRTGTGEETVVCGAPNLTVGDKIAFAYVGAELFDGHTGERFKLKAAKIRGVVSAGMVCSEKELGLSQEHEGILVLLRDAPVGMNLAEYMGDVILDAEITPNRPDCLSVLGIARELSALSDEPVRIPDVSYPEIDEPIESRIKITIADPDLCSRYCATLIKGIKVGESPEWLKSKLIASGMRPINNIVDITNYVMLEQGQPLHAFDYEKISGREIIVRRARKSEEIVSLDKVTRKLTSDMLVIADRDRAVAIAGVMGGLDSEVTENTTSILLESANFKATSIHYTARTLGLPSEASYRFERGVSPGLTIPAVRRATKLMVELAGGKAIKGIADNYPGRKEPERITVSMDKMRTVLGMNIDMDTAVKTLESLGIACEKSGNKIIATPPYWRSDIHIPEDVIEEVARITGYEKIPLTLMCQELPHQTPEKPFYLRQKVRENLTGQGFQEIISFSLTNETVLSKALSDKAPMKLVNPMTEDQTCLRTTLRAGLLLALAANRRFEEDGIRIFEIGKLYLSKSDDLPDEPEMLCGILAGLRFARSWHGSTETMDFYDAKGTVQGLLSKLGIEATFVETKDIALTAGKQASVIVAGSEVGVIGEVHPKVLTAFEINEPVYLFELNLTKLYDCVTEFKSYKPLPRFPQVPRDIAIVLDEDVTYEKVAGIISSFPLVSDVKLFDVYSGKQVPSGKKSLAYRIIFQLPDHTLTDKEVNSVLEKILKKLSEEVGATLRA